MKQNFTEPLRLGDFGLQRQQLEDKAIILLREYYTIDDDIKLQSAYAQGDDLPLEPRVTANLRSEEDGRDVLWELHAKPLNERQDRIATTVLSYVRGAQVTYATKQRVERLVSRVSAVTRDDQEQLDLFVRMLRDAIGEPDDTRLNNMEALVDRRWKMIDDARQELQRLKQNKKYIGDTLAFLASKWPEYHQVLWLKYVEDKTIQKVCEKMALSEDMYRRLRYRAMSEFLQRVSHILPVLQVGKAEKKHKQGRKTPAE